jgi:hypothetical protein
MHVVVPSAELRWGYHDPFLSALRPSFYAQRFELSALPVGLFCELPPTIVDVARRLRTAAPRSARGCPWNTS